MADRLGFQAQIVSIIEMLANSAVVEICKLVDDAYAALASQLDQEREESRKENRVLRQKLLEMDEKMQSYERRLRGAPLHPLTAKDPSEETPTGVSIPSSYPRASLCHSEVMMEITCRPGAKCEAMNGLCSSLKVRSSDGQGPGSACRDFTGRDAPIKTEIQTNEPADDKLHPSHLSVPLELDEPSPEHLNNLDLDLRHKHVSHLGAAYADAQCGLGNTNSRNSSSSFLSQEEGDSLDCPPTMLVIGGTRKMAAFPAPLAMAAANATVKATPPPPPPSRSTASSAKALSQTWPPKNSVAFVKEPKVCAVCRCVFSCVAALKLHHQVHVRDRPYTCPHCGKGFAQPNNLRVHLLVHTGERRYRCTLCGKSFISSSHLKRHHTVHTQEKPYSCSRCGQSFSQMCSVRRHRQQSQCGL